MAKNNSIPTLLALDASENISTVALQFCDPNSGTVKIDSLKITDIKLQSAILLPSIEKLLKSNNLKLTDLDALVVANGPGRFTGLRVATSLTQGLAYSLDKKIITINSLQLLAQQYVEKTVDARCQQSEIWVCQKSFNNHYYQAKFILDNDLVYFCNPGENADYIKTKTELLNLLNQEHDYILVGSGWLDVIDSHSQIYQSIYSESPDVAYCFKQANIAYLSHNFTTSFELQPVYGVNPYK